MVSRAVLQLAEAGDRAGSVRTVAVAVERVRVRLGNRVCRDGGRCVVGIAHEVPPLRNLGAGEGDGLAVGVVARSGGVVGQAVGVVGRVARAAEVGVVVVDAGVYDRDLHARAGPAALGPGLRSADVGHALGEGRLVGGHEMDAHDVRHGRDRRHGSGRDVDVNTVIRVLHLTEDGAAALADRIHDRRLVGLHLIPPRVAVGRRHGRAVVRGVAHACRDRLVGELDHQVELPALVDEIGRHLRIDLDRGDLLEARNRARGDRGGGRHRPECECGYGQRSEHTTSHLAPPVAHLVSGRLTEWPHSRLTPCRGCRCSQRSTDRTSRTRSGSTQICGIAWGPDTTEGPRHDEGPG